MKRPLGLVTLLYGGGLFLGEWFRLSLLVLFPISLTLAVIALCSQRLRPFLLFPLIVLTGWTNLVWHTAIVSPQDLRLRLAQAPEDVVIRGRLVETPDERIYLHNEQESFRTLA